MLVTPGNAPLGPRGQRREPLRLAGLVPEGHAAKEIRTLQVESFQVVLVVSLVLDRQLERPGEPDRVEHVPPVADPAVAGPVTLPARLTEPVSGSRPESPGVIEVVLGPGPLQAGNGFSIDGKEIIALTEPAILAQSDREHRANILSRTAQVGDQVISTLRRRIFLPVLGVEIGCLRG